MSEYEDEVDKIGRRNQAAIIISLISMGMSVIALYISTAG